MKMNLSKLQFFFALLVGKFTAKVLEIRGSRGTALPGLIAEKICPRFIELSRSRLGKVVAITGTNGKTSTQTLLAHSLSQLSSIKIAVNSRGANLKRGIISELIKGLEVLSGNSYGVSIFEVEEATLPKITAELAPDFLIITNFFRDQLDAYGEIDRTKSHVASAIMKMDTGVVIANGDDPQVLDTIAKAANGKLNYVLVNVEGFQNYINYETLATTTPSLGELEIKTLTYPKALVTADLGIAFKLDGQPFKLQLPGYYSYYSFAFSHALLSSLRDNSLINYSNSQLADAVESCLPAFGRGEIIKLNEGRWVRILLIKNPIGFNLALDMLAAIENKFSLSVLINDKIADGRDVSWLWDSSLEKINKLKLIRILSAGERRQDMILRLKYAVDKNQQAASAVEVDSIDNLIEIQLEGDAQEIVLATYTAMNLYRDKLLARAPKTN
jgi:UDP-N-acetylmuramyl tripeptide synthase